MALQKISYIKNQTVITANNLNNIQDAIIENNDNISNIQNQLNNKVRFVEEVSLTPSRWNGLVQTVALKNTLLETDTPHICLVNVNSSTLPAYGKIASAETVNDNGTIKLKFTCLEEAPTEVILTLQVEVIR